MEERCCEVKLKAQEAEQEVNEKTLEYHKCIQRRNAIDMELKVGAEGKIALCQEQLVTTEAAKEAAQADLQRAKLQILRHKVFGRLKHVGMHRNVKQAEDLNHSNVIKTRAHRDCQEDRDGRRPEGMHPVCNYFQVLDKALKVMVQEGKAPKEFWEEVKMKQEWDHVREHHSQDLLQAFEVLKQELTRYDDDAASTVAEYTDRLEATKQELEAAQMLLSSRKRLDSYITIGRRGKDTASEPSVAKRLLQGLDLLVLDGSTQVASSFGTKPISNFFEEHLFPKLPPVSPDEAADAQKAFGYLLRDQGLTNKELDLSRPLHALHVTDGAEMLHSGAWELLREALIRRFKSSSNDPATLPKLLELEQAKKGLQEVCQEITRCQLDLDLQGRGLVQLKEREEHIKKLLQWNEAEANSLAQASSSEQQLQRMLSMYGQMQAASDEESRKDEELMKQKQAELQAKSFELASAKSQLDPQLVESVVRLLHASSHAMRFGLNIDSLAAGQVNCVYCPGASSEFMGALEAFTRQLAKEINSGSVRLTARSIPSSKLQAILSKLPNVCSEHQSDPDLLSASRYIFQEFQRKRQDKMLEVQHCREGLKADIQALTNRKKIRDEFWKPAAAARVNLIRDFLSFLGQKVVAASRVQRHPKLQEYKLQRATKSFVYQLEVLTSVFGHKELCDAVQALAPMKQKWWCRAVLEVLEPYLEIPKSADRDDPKQVLDVMVSSLKLAASKGFSDTDRLQQLIKKKRPGTGGAEYLLKKLSSRLHEDEDQAGSKPGLLRRAARALASRLWSEAGAPDCKDFTDPWVVYKCQLESKEATREADFRAEVAKKEESIARLEKEKAQILFQDTAEEDYTVDCLDRCIACLEKSAGFLALERRFTSHEEIRGSSADYVVFQHAGRQVAIRLLHSDPLAKGEEIQEIQRVRGNADFVKDELSHLVVRKQRLAQEVAEALQQCGSMDLRQIQLRLRTLGLCLAGYDSFDNGQEVTGIDSLVSVALDALLGQTNPYIVDGVNNTSLALEQQTKQLVSDWGGEESKDLGKILDFVNQHFASPQARLTEARLLTSQHRDYVPLEIPWSNVECCREVKLAILRVQDLRVQGLRVQDRFFLIVPIGKAKMFQDNAAIDLKLRISHLTSQLKGEEDLWAALCHARFQEVHKCSLSDSTTLAAGFRDERANLAKAWSVQDCLRSHGKVAGSILS